MLPQALEISPKDSYFLAHFHPSPQVLPRKKAVEQVVLFCCIQKAQKILQQRLSNHSAAPNHLLQALGFDLLQSYGTMLNAPSSPLNMQ